MLQHTKSLNSELSKLKDFSGKPVKIIDRLRANTSSYSINQTGTHVSASEVNLNMPEEPPKMTVEERKELIDKIRKQNQAKF